VHAIALTDVLLGEPPPRAVDSLRESFETALSEGRFAAIVLEEPQGPALEKLLQPWLRRYERSPASPITEPLALTPTVGMVTHSPYVLVRRE
jgi:hypothetical protein